MATDVRSTQETSVTSLVTGIISDVQDLVKQQFEMLKQEVRSDVRKTRDAGFVLGLGAWLGLIGGILLLMMLVHLTQWLTEWPLWVCYGIWGALLFASGVTAFFIGKMKLD